jgi:2'-5' RNA ligase
VLRRLFFALWPPREWSAALAELVADLLQEAGGRAVGQADLHLTLCFLGAVDDRAIPALLLCARQLDVAGFSMQLDRIEYWRGPRALVAVASQAPPQARRLVHALEGAVAELGFTPDLKPWRPHVTLARNVSPQRALSGRQSGFQMAAKLQWSVSSFHLAESRSVRNADAGGEQARYALLGSWPLRS